MEAITLLFLATLAAAAVWAGGAYFFPFRDCRKCGGTGRKVRHLNRSHYALCPRCAGTGSVRRPGARLVHRTVFAIRSQSARARHEARERRAADRAAPDRPQTGHRARNY